MSMIRARRAVPAACLFSALGAALPAGAKQPIAMAPVVSIASGQVQGVVQSRVDNHVVTQVYAYLGIPYAAPPVGNLRFQPPQPPASFSGVRSAAAYGAVCPQDAPPQGASVAEDCLTINVQTPANLAAGSKLPVMVWVHGGGLTSGTGADYDAASLVRAGNVIVVTFNYRLGLLGYLAHPALGAEQGDGASGNYGLQDQIAALNWVRANIAAFGGSPGKITIFGESAGGQSVLDLLVSPLTPKLAGAIIQSGAYAPSTPARADAEKQGVSIATDLGCSGSNTAIAACLRAAAPGALVSEAGKLTGNTPVAPNIDNRALTAQPFQAIAAGNFQRVPLINGSNHDEYRLFVATDDIFGAGPLTPQTYLTKLQGSSGPLYAQVLAQYPLSAYPSPNLAYVQLATDFAFSCSARVIDRLASKYVPVYAYEFSEPAPPPVLLPPDPNFPVLGAAHASELVFLFPQFRNTSLDLAPGVITARQQALAAQMQAAWTSHARYGRPLLRGGTLWYGYNAALDQVVSLTSTGSHTDYGLAAAHQCGFWTPLIALLAGLPAGSLP